MAKRQPDKSFAFEIGQDVRVLRFDRYTAARVRLCRRCARDLKKGQLTAHITQQDHEVQDYELADYGPPVPGYQIVLSSPYGCDCAENYLRVPESRLAPLLPEEDPTPPRDLLAAFGITTIP